MSNIANTEESVNSEDEQPALSEEQFNIRQFNKNYQMEQNAFEEESALESEEMLVQLNNNANKVHIKKSLVDSSIFEIFRGIINSWFHLLDDLMRQKYSTEIFTKDDRLFYFGITFVIIAVIMFLYHYFVEIAQ